jgi:signal transduction histidine kinase/ligand-binding sensor domain-containing protein/DNA-binding response OmpR family regulator
LLLFQICFLSTHLYPQLNNLIFEHITVDDGLPENSVRAILQDHIGFMWFGTQNGLVKYDGYEMTVYQQNPDDSSSFTGRIIYSLYEDVTGDIWIGTWDDGLHKFDRATKTFRRFKAPQFRSEIYDTLNTIQSNQVTAISGGQESNELWISTWGGGLSRLDIRNLSFKHYQNNPDDSTSIPSDLLCDIHSDGEGNIWIAASRGGLVKFVPQKEEFTLYKPAHDKENNGFDDPYTICEDRFGALWIGTIGSGVFKFDRKSETFRHYQHDPDNPNSLSHNEVYSICEDQSGLIWIATWGGGLNVFDREKDHFRRYPYNFRDPNSVSSNRTWSIFEDQTGVLWVGTHGGGLNKMDRGKQRFRRYEHEPNNPNSLSDNEVYSICEDQSGIVWVGTHSRGLTKFTPQSEKAPAKTFRHYQHDPANPNSLSDNQVRSIYEDRQGTLWIGTNDEGLNRFDKKKNRFKRYRHDPGNPHSLGSNWVRAIYEDRLGILWIGTFLGGLNRYDPATEIFTRFRVGKENQILKIFEDHFGTLWIGTNGDGLQQFDREKESFTAHGLDEFQFVNTIYEDNSGNLWIGTFLRGLYLFDRDNSRFINFDEKKGLINNTIMGILEGEDGNLWISTLKGISRFDPRKRSFKNFSNQDGLQAPYYWGVCKSQFTGEMFFGGQKGLTVFHPDSVKDNPYPPQVAITEFKLFNEPVKPGAVSPLKEAITITREIRLAYWQNDISLGFAALHFNNSQKNEYAYFLENYEDDWRYVGNQRSATYTNLDPGEYTFRVKGSNNDGVWNEEGASLKIIITPPWWNTWWAYFIYAVLILGTLYGLRRYELSRQRLKHNLELEYVEAEKLKEVDRMKSRFFANISHEFRAPLTLIQGPVEELLSGEFKGNVTEQYQRILRNTRRLLRLVNQLLDISRLEAGRVKLYAQPLDIVALTRQLTMAFESLASVRNIQLKFAAQEQPLTVYIDREKYEKIIINLLSNAIKFTGEGGFVEVAVNSGSQTTSATATVTATSLPHSEFVEITVRDTGIGISAEHLPHIFDRFYQVDDSAVLEHSGTGIGLALTKELVELHHGEISVESEPGKGTEFTVRLPLGKEHLQAEEIADTGYQMPDTGYQKPDAVYSLETVDVDLSGIRDQASGIHSQSLNRPITKSPNILIVEDNPDMRAYIRDHLKNTYRISEAEDGLAGFAAATDLMPDLIISDVMMPNLDGYQLCEKLKNDERTSHIPVILLTAKSSGESKMEGLELGADDYLIKPFDARELQVRVKNLIEQRRKLRERFASIIKIEPKDLTVTPKDAEFLQRAIDIVEANMNNEEFSVERFGREIGLSRSQLRRKITALTDFSPTDFILSLRLKRAARLLQQQAGTVSEIAYEVGFNNLSYFARAFKKQFGHTPSEFVNANKAGE